uniref:Uncharacterized protein n=1 Tax=Salvator merianae TaxID=96440 RepID=A0A8D0E753_SALMN
MQKILKTNIPFRPELFLLGIVENNVEGINVLLQNMVTAARIVYAQKWKGELLPTIEMNGIKILILGIYAPNTEKQKFFEDLRDKILTLDYENWCLLGDWNVVIDPSMDKLASKDIKATQEDAMEIMLCLPWATPTKCMPPPFSPVSARETTFLFIKKGLLHKIGTVL